MPTTPINPKQLPQILDNLPPGVKLELKKTPQGTLMANIPQTKTQIIDKEYADLKNVGITMTDAAEKYDVPRGALEKWVHRTNDVHFVDETVYPKTVCEAEVALCARIYHDRQISGLKGVPYFDNDGLIITERKHPRLAAYRRQKRNSQVK